MEPTTASGFFRVSPYRISCLVILLAIAAIGFTPWGMQTTLLGASLAGWALNTIQTLGPIMLIIDLFRSNRKALAEKSDVTTPDQTMTFKSDSVRGEA